MSGATNKIKLNLRKRAIETFNEEAFNLRIRRIEDDGYPFFNEFLLNKILDYVNSATLLKFSEVCWKTRILVRDKMNPTWFYYYLKAVGELPTKSVKHCHLLAEKGVGLGGKNCKKYRSGKETDVLLECVDERLRVSKGLPGQYNHYNNNGGLNWNQYWSMMRQPISQYADKITMDDIFKLEEGEWNNHNPEVNYICRRRHKWLRTAYPRGHPVYLQLYDKNVNYYWTLATKLANEVESQTKWSNLELQIKNISRNIAKLEKQRDEIKKVIELKKLAKERAEVTCVPSKRPRFHMFRDEWERKNGKYLSPTEASKLWGELSEQEKIKYSDLAELQYQDHMRKKEVSAIKF